MQTTLIARRFFAAFVIVMLTACGGGGSPSTLPAVTPTPAPSGNSGGTQATTGPLPFQVTVAASASSTRVRKPNFTSPGAQSFAVFLFASGGTAPSKPTATINLSSCVPSSAGSSTYTCTVTVPLGPTNVTVTAYSGQNGTGTVLGSTTFQATVTTTTQPIPLTMVGTLSVVRLSLETPILTAGTAGTSVIDVNGYDATGALIVSPGGFSQITVSSDSNAVSLSGTTATSSGTKITVSYGGGTAPYAVHFTASGTAANLAVGATLYFTPSQSLVFLQSFNPGLALTTIAINANDEPPQSVLSVPSYSASTFGLPGPSSFAPSLGRGYSAVAAFYFGSGANGCEINTISPSGSLAIASPTIYSGPAIGLCPIASEANGDLIYVSGTLGSTLVEDSVSASGALSATGRTIVPPAPPIGDLDVSLLGVASNASGQLATVQYWIASSGNSVEELLVYAGGATGSATPTIAVPLTQPAGAAPAPAAIAIANDGSMALLWQMVNVGVPDGYVVQRFSSSGALTATMSPPSLFGYERATGIAVDSASDVLVAYEGSTTSTYGARMDVFAGGSTESTPTATVPISARAGIMFPAAGPIIAASPAPATVPAAESGDMIGYAASRTWTYQVTPSFGNAYYIGIYADPQLVNGNIRLVGYQSTSSNPFSGSPIGSVDLQQQGQNYLAVDFASVSSGVSGTSGAIPGTPLFVPNNLSLGETWNPLQNASWLSLTGITASAQVTSIGATTGGAACVTAGLASSSTGAAVQYSYVAGGQDSDTNSVVEFVPGCGMVGAQTANGTNVVLQSVGTNTSLGQQVVPRGQPPMVAALHALWRATLSKVRSIR